MNKETLINDIITIIREWNTVYHPTDSDYRRLAEQIIDHLETEHIISFTQKNTDKNIER